MTDKVSRKYEGMRRSQGTLSKTVGILPSSTRTTDRRFSKRERRRRAQKGRRKISLCPKISHNPKMVGHCPTGQYGQWRCGDDWALPEAMAIGSLGARRFSVRLADGSGRGTFSHASVEVRNLNGDRGRRSNELAAKKPECRASSRSRCRRTACSVLI